jgi:superfamily II DNA or RNA helicase
MADRKDKRAWLAMLTPGAGKTVFALYVAAALRGPNRSRLMV